MQSAKCKKCGKPIADIYAGRILCDSCIKEKSNLLHILNISRAVAILVAIPLLIGVILSILQINSGLTTYFFVLWQASMMIGALSVLYITISKLRKYQ